MADDQNGVQWFSVRKELSQRRRMILMSLSFLLPLLGWWIAAHGPWWEVAYQVQIPAESSRLQSVYVAGNRLTRETWETFQKAIEADNDEILKARTSGTPIKVSSRQNKKILRQIYQPALINGWLQHGQETDDAAIRQIWLSLADDKLEMRKQFISKRNLEIIKDNARLLIESGEELPKQSLLKLLPEASEEVSRPVYLIPPDLVAQSFWNGIRAKPTVLDEQNPEGGKKKSLLERYAESWRTIVSGFLLAIAIALPLGLLAGTYDFFSKLIEPFVNFFSYMPAPAFGVVLMAIFGLESGPKVMLVCLGTLPCAILMFAKTTRRLDGALMEAAQTLGANQKQLLLNVVVPGVLPNIYNDLRLLFGTAWTWLVIAELLGFKSGLAEVIDTHGRRFQFEIVYPAILMIGFSGFFMDQILAAVGRHLFPWLETPTKGSYSKFIERVTKGVLWLSSKVQTTNNKSVDEPQSVLQESKSEETKPQLEMSSQR